MSKASLFRRIEKLERSRPAQVVSAESPAPRIIEGLTAAGFNRGENESWAEVWARSPGITYRELKCHLQRIAQGC